MSTYGTRVAAEVRRRCNKLSVSQRRRLTRVALGIINGKRRRCKDKGFCITIYQNDCTCLVVQRKDGESDKRFRTRANKLMETEALEYFLSNRWRWLDGVAVSKANTADGIQMAKEAYAAYRRQVTWGCRDVPYA